jgi:hypothetical protein
MMKSHILRLTWLLTILLSSCAQLPSTNNLVPSPTVMTEALQTSTPQSTETPTPTLTQTPTANPATLTPARTPTHTLTPTPFPITLEPISSPSPEAALPEVAIQIFTPGPLSKVVSPLLVRAFLRPGANGRIRLELLGEDGRLLVRQVLVFNAPPRRKVNLSVEVDFEIAAVAETGRLRLSVDDQYGRTTDLTSVDLILLSSGEADINPPGDLRAPIIIEEPEAYSRIEGGEVIVSGLARPTNDQPLKIEIIDQTGKIIGERLAAVAESADGGHRPFATSVTYRVDEPTRALLLVIERGTRILGPVQISSLESVFSP